MKLLLLCAGYGTRLEKDLKECQDPELQNLIGVPKPLLPVASKPLITHWADLSDPVDAIDQIVVVTNGHFFGKFDHWKAGVKSSKKVTVLNDGTSSNDDRLGAVADIRFTIKAEDLGLDDVLVIAGDTLFFHDFSLGQFVEMFKNLQKVSPGASLIVHCPCPEERVHLHGIIELAEAGNENFGFKRVASFLEKPQPSMTSSRWQSPCFYLLHSSCLPLVDVFLEATSDLPLSSRDATGNFLAYLIKNTEVYSVEISGRFDVGNLKSYLECCQQMTS